MPKLSLEFAILAGIVCTSKFILYNEELLVLLAFVGFVFTVFYGFGTQIAEMFEERKSQVEDPIMTYCALQKQALYEALLQEMQASRVNSHSHLKMMTQQRFSCVAMEQHKLSTLKQRLWIRATTYAQTNQSMKNSVQVQATNVIPLFLNLCQQRWKNQLL